MSIYSKNLSGLNQKVMVGTATYTAITTLQSFSNSVAGGGAANGEIGVFNNDATFTRRTTALTAGLSFLIAQKRDGFVNKTPILAFNDIFRSLRTAYTAPVIKVVALGYHPTANAAGNILWDFTQASATNTVTQGLNARDLTPGNQPFPVQEGYATVNSTTANQYSVLSAIVSQFNGELDYENVFPDKFCFAEILQSTTTTAITVAATVSVQNGQRQIVFNAAPTGAPAVGGYIAIGGAGQTGSVFQIKAIAADTVTYTLDRVYQGVSNSALAIANVLTAPFVSGTSLLGVRLIGTTTDNIFTASMFGNPSINATVLSTVTAWILGSGAGPQILDLEQREGFEFDGIGSTANAPFRADYGYPTAIATAAGTYDQIFLDFAPTLKPGAALPFYETKQIQRVLIAAPNGGTLNSTLQTIFGV